MTSGPNVRLGISNTSGLTVTLFKRLPKLERLHAVQHQYRIDTNSTSS